MKFTEDNLELCNRKNYYFQLESLVLGFHKTVVCKLSYICSHGFDIFLPDGKVREEQYGKGKEKEFKFDGFPLLLYNCSSVFKGSTSRLWLSDSVTIQA